MRKKLLSLLVTCSMVFSLFPAMAFAGATAVAEVDGTQYADLQEAVAAANGKTVTLLTDVTVYTWSDRGDSADLQDDTKEIIFVKKGDNVTLDLNGHMISGNSTDNDKKACITNYGTLTIKDSTTEKNGSIVMNVNASYEGPGIFTVRNHSIGSVLNLESGNLELKKSGEDVIAEKAMTIQIQGNSTLNMTGGNVKGCGGRGVIQQHANNVDKSVLDIKGGTIEATGNNNAVTTKITDKSANASVKISGGTFTGNVAKDGAFDVTYNITGGTFKNTEKPSNIAAGYKVTGTAGNWQVVADAPTVKSIAIDTQATKLTYKCGDTLDVTGLKIKVTMSDASTKTVDVEASMVSGFDSSAVTAKQTLTITYEDKTTTYDIAIELADGPVAPAGLTATAPTTDGGSDGKINGTKATMEYSTTTDFAKATACGEDSTAVAAGTYYVRVAETATAKAGAYATVEVPAYVAPAPTPTPGKPGSNNKPAEKEDITVNPDGSTTKTEIKADGTKVETTTNNAGDKTVETTDKLGNSKTEVVMADGTTATSETNAKGKTNAEVKLSQKAVENAAKENKPVELPIPQVEASNAAESENAPVVKVNTGSDKPVPVKINVKDPTPGTVAVIVKADGTEEIVRKSLVDKEGVVLDAADGVTVKIVDNSKEFTDAKDHWAKEAVEFVTARNIYNGTSDTTFEPDLGMTRGMLAKVLHNLENNPAALTNSDFNDVDADTWYTAAVNWAAEKKIVEGYDNGGFGPDDIMTREQLITMLYRYTGSPAVNGKSLDFADAASVSAYAVDAMKWAVENSLVEGVGDNMLAPTMTADRAQVATLIQRFMAL